MYGLEYITIRKNINGQIVNIPVDKFPKPHRLPYETNDYNMALKHRNMLCEVLNYGYVRIVDIK